MIEVSVHNPREVKSTLSSYIVYTLTYTDRTSTHAEVVKRYSDFDALRNALLARWPGVLIPSLPPKKIIGMTEEFIVERCSLLSQFCKQLAERPHLWYGQEFQTFLNENEVDKKLAALAKPNYKQILEKYKQVFENEHSKEITTKMLVKVVQFSGFVNKCLPLVYSYQEALTSLIKLQEANERDEITTVAALFPDFQNVVLGKYDVKRILADPDFDSLRTAIQDLKEKASCKHISKLCFQLSVEGKQIEAFSDVIKSKKALQEKQAELDRKEKSLNEQLVSIANGKGSGGFFSFLKGSPEEQKRKIEAVLDLTVQEKEAVNFLTTISISVLANIEIDKFKAKRQEVFIRTLREVAVCEKVLAETKREIYSILLQHPNCSL